jgi:NAD(P)-dependent dehydrogenase (short-subunit alcohol dehydrogenase family)
VAVSNRDEPLAGVRMLITGATGTLGRSLVEEALAQGAAVTATARAASLARRPLPGRAYDIPADLCNPEECLRLPEQAAERMGGLDVLLNNAAVLVRKPFTSVEPADLDDAWAVNLRAPVLLMQASLPFLERGCNPAIVNVVSSAGVSGGIASVSAYAMTKAGLIVATKTVARE